MKNIPEISFKRDKAKQVNGFELIELEELISNLNKPINHNPFQPHRLGFLAILIITDSEVNHFVDFKTHNMKKGDAIVISKGQIHAFDKFSDYKGYLVLFTEAFMQKYIAQSTIAQINHLYNYFIRQDKINNLRHNQSLISELKNELKESSSSLPNIVGALLSIYLLKLNNENIRSTAPLDNRDLSYFNNFKQLVEANHFETRNAKVYASDLSLSYKHLNEVCKKTVRMTAKSFIDSYVILEAKRKLVTTSLSVKEIAFAIGFDEPTNFLKYFKKHTRLTPVEFRNTLA